MKTRFAKSMVLMSLIGLSFQAMAAGSGRAAGGTNLRMGGALPSEKAPTLKLPPVATEQAAPSVTLPKSKQTVPTMYVSPGESSQSSAAVDAAEINRQGTCDAKTSAVIRRLQQMVDKGITNARGILSRIRKKLAQEGADADCNKVVEEEINLDDALACQM